MNLITTTPADLDFASSKQPYYLITSGQGGAYAWYKALAFCSALNAKGFESYLSSNKTHGRFWAPLLLPHVQTAHYLAGKKPVLLHLGLDPKNPLDVGTQIHFWWGGVPKQSQSEKLSLLKHLYVQGDLIDGPFKRLHLPLPELSRCARPSDATPPDKSLLYVSEYTGLIAQGLRDLERIDADFADKFDKLVAQLHSARVLYLYEWSDLAVLARWAGCAVVLMPNAQCLPERFAWLDEWGVEGLAWGDADDQVAQALATVALFSNTYLTKVANCSQELEAFIDDTQVAAEAASMTTVWPQSSVDMLPDVFKESSELAARADRLKWARIHRQYAKWGERSSLREIDAQIYAEYLVSGHLPALSLVIDHRSTPLNDLADTLDSASAALGQPERVFVVADQAAPDGFESTDTLVWLDVRGLDLTLALESRVNNPLTLLVRAGTTLAPHALMEWRLAAQANPLAQIIYADDDVRGADSQGQYPDFKPRLNVELLRCTNYLGTAVAVRSSTWLGMGCPLFDGQLYRKALQLLSETGRAAFAHVDLVLSHGTGELSAAIENSEFEAARDALALINPGAKLVPLERLGTWLPSYENTAPSSVTLVVSTGTQTGYLSSLLSSVLRYKAPNLREVILVCTSAQQSEVEGAVSSFALPAMKIVILDQTPYNHSAALNAGIAQASCDVVLVADDDTEVLHEKWLEPMLGVLAQSDVGCVAPRLVASGAADPKVVGGPMILGVNGIAASYVGESQGLGEAGVYSRLQLTQDVSAVAGHFFLTKRTDWQTLGGFDEITFNLFHAVLDYSLRLCALGKRHVWTPLTNVMHQGGKTIEQQRRDISRKIVLANQEVNERQALHARWAKALANDPCYNRHLSLLTPFDVESDIVVDWQPQRHDRPRVLALPIHSGAGQYRVVEPLNALQDAGLAQTSVVLPGGNGQFRLMQPLELVRAAPDRLILQHSVDDGQLSLIDGFKNAAPDIKIIQTVDDLIGEVPEKHPNRQYQIREGHSRIMQALTKSDRLIVTTQPLADHYRKYVADVHIVPNTLGQQWMGLRQSPKPRARLRVGWVGAGQHQGDLELVNAVVRELASEVDWVFMGMCTEEIKPLLKEFHGFVSIGDYPKKMAELDLDIAIAPIEDNFFNQCKSNLRLLEYGAMGWPVVCSDVYPYQSDHPPVVRVKNDPDTWVAAIRSLYDNKLRHANAEALHQWVMSTYLLEVKVKTWYKAIFQ